MAENLVATVQYTNQKSCSVEVNLPSLRLSYNKDNVAGSQVLKIVAPEEAVGYFNLFPTQRSSEQKNGILCVNGLYASKLGFRNKSQVSIKLLQNVPACVRAWIEPVSVDDWEILELHAEQIESSLLDQIRVLWAGQVFPLWVDGNVCIFLKTVAIEPESHCTVLMPLTELIVEPKVRREKSNYQTSKPKYNAAVNEVSSPIHEDTETSAATSSELAVPGQSHSILVRLFRLTFLRRIFSFFTYVFRLLRSRIVSSMTSILSIFYPPSPIDEKGKTSKDISARGIFGLNDFPGKLDLILRVEPMPESLRVPTWRQAGCIMLNATSDECLYRTPPTKAKIDRKDCENETECGKNGNNLDDTGVFLVDLQKLPSQREQEIKNSNQKSTDKDFTVTSDTAKNAVVRMCIQALSQFAMILRQDFNCDSHILDVPSHSLKMSSDLRRQLRIGAFSKVRIRKLKSMPEPIRGNVTKISFGILEAFPPTAKNIPLQDLCDSFERWLSAVADEYHPLPVTVGTIVSVPVLPLFSLSDEIGKGTPEGSGSTVELVIQKFQLKQNVAVSVNEYFLLSYKDLKNLETEFAPISPESQPVPTLDQIDPVMPQDSVEGLVPSHQKLLADCMTHAETVLRSRPLPNKLPGKLGSAVPGCLLVTGPGGVGKSTMCRALLRRLYTSSEHRAYVQSISCSSLKGKKPDTIKKVLQGTVAELEWRQPSVLLLDDLDHLLPSCCSPDGERSPGAVYALQLSAIFKNTLTAVCRRKVEHSSPLQETPNRVLIIATAASQQSIHPMLLPSLGCHLFSKTVVMELPNSRERVEILRSMVAKHTDVDVRMISSLDLDGIAQATEGYSVYDFMQITKRAILSSKSEKNKKWCANSSLCAKDYDDALTNYVPVSLQDANLHKPKIACWSDVGGLELVRKNLMEKLVWPVKYSRLYQTAGVQLQSGMLLYGPPGCGKTMLAGVVAHECGLNFISVKGPELLSKYIGASEAAVREVFSRASAAAPCILFFDEFDSIAQKRGHDSTGVTDRVVNQILTHLDGVEPLSGVYVLAATSRPDLIDPALLRPGRLDTHLHCPMPDTGERCSILRALLSKVDMVDEIDLGNLAERCKNFTGADLRALVYDAQLKSLHPDQDNIRLEEVFIEHVEKPLSSSSDSSFSTAGLELEEHYNSNGMSAVLKDLKEEEEDPGRLEDSCSPRVTVSDLTHTAGELVQAIRNDANKLGPWNSSDVENRYQICYGLTSPQFSNSDLLELENEVQRRRQANPSSGSAASPRSLYFSSLYSKQSAEDAIPEAMQSLISTITSANSKRDGTAEQGSSSGNKVTVLIGRRHLESALLSARPSVSAAERQRYAEICRSFTGKYAPRGGDVEDSERDILERMRIRNQQRATLA